MHMITFRLGIGIKLCVTIVNQYRFPRLWAHKLRMRSVDFAGREFSIDYFEFIPVDMIRDEDRL